MGSSESSPRKKNLQITNEEEELRFYTSVSDPLLGDVKIYTSSKVPLCYILKLERKCQGSRIYNQFKKVEQLQVGSILSMYGFRIDRQTCCGKITKEVIVSYWEYYNFYFDDYLEKRTRHICMFVDSEIWHMVDMCCQTYGLFRKYGIFYDVNPSTFVVTPQGKLKAVWAHLKAQNSHLKYIQYFDNKSYPEKFFYSPEQLEYMYLQERTIKLDFDKCNSFRLGMILLQALTLSDVMSVCYNPSITRISFNTIRNLIMQKVMPSYSVEIVRLVRSLLKEDPRERPTLMEVYEMYNSFFSAQYELRVCGGGNKPKQSMEDPNSQLQERQMSDFLGNKNEKDFSDVKTLKLNKSIRRT